MAGLEMTEVILAIIIGTLAAIVYSLRVLILLERRIANMEENVLRLTRKVLNEELVIEKSLPKVTKRKISNKKVTKKRKR
jgi:hypothetical protein